MPWHNDITPGEEEEDITGEEEEDISRSLPPGHTQISRSLPPGHTRISPPIIGRVAQLVQLGNGWGNGWHNWHNWPNWPNWRNWGIH